MLLTSEELKQQTRQLWKTCFNDSEDFMDIYFEEKYDEDNNFTARPDGFVAGAMQMLPYCMTFHESVLHAGYVSGLGVLPDYRGRGMAARLLHNAHRELYRRGGTFSFLIPADEGLRKFYERPEHGAFWTATFRREVEMPDEGDTDDRIEISRPDEWPMELFVFFNRHTVIDFMLHPAENDFYAAIEACDAGGGYVLVARRKRRVVGLCLASPDADGRLFIRSMLVPSKTVKSLFVRRLKALHGCETVYARIPSPGAIKQAQPYAMARVVNVERLLTAVLRAYPDFQIHIGVDGDLYIPENNGYYLIENGRLSVTDRRPDSIVTPGGLAAMFLGSHPMYMEMLLDE